jgi:heptaprenyl diphosphate synthase
MKKAETLRLARQKRCLTLFSGRALCIAGLCVMPALVFNPNTYGRIIQFLFLWFLAWLAGKKNNPLITISVIAGIAAFNLLVPYGRVLVSIGAFRITAGALLAGIHRAVTLEGLIMLSKVSIRPDLRLPGSFGALIGESFRIFARLMEQKGRIRAKHIIAGIDELMIELSEEGANTETSTTGTVSEQTRSTGTGIVILCAVVVLAWVPIMYSSF